MSFPKDVPAPTIACADQTYADINKQLNDIIAAFREGMARHPEYAHSTSLLWFKLATDYRDKMIALDSVEAYVATCNNIADLFAAAVFRIIAHEASKPLGETKK